jgi:hypothetical protein
MVYFFCGVEKRRKGQRKMDSVVVIYQSKEWNDLIDKGFTTWIVEGEYALMIKPDYM